MLYERRFCSRVGPLHPVAAIYRASFLHRYFCLSTHKVSLAEEERILPNRTLEAEEISQHGDGNPLGFQIRPF